MTPDEIRAECDKNAEVAGVLDDEHPGKFLICVVAAVQQMSAEICERLDKLIEQGERPVWFGIDKASRPAGEGEG